MFCQQLCTEYDYLYKYSYDLAESVARFTPKPGASAG